MVEWIRQKKSLNFQPGSSDLPLLSICVWVVIVMMYILPLSITNPLDGDIHKISTPLRISNYDTDNHLENHTILEDNANSPRSGKLGSSQSESVLVKRAASNSWKPNNVMSFGQLRILAEEEAKCLQDFGGQRNKTTVGGGGAVPLENGTYTPFVCSKSSEKFAQCEQCRILTAVVRTSNECEVFCGHDQQSCLDKCRSINSAVLNKAGSLDTAHDARNSQDITNQMKSNNKELHLFNSSFSDVTISNQELNLKFYNKETSSSRSLGILQSPEVFCEGVNRPEGTVLKSVGPISVEETEAGTKNHFVLLKWRVQYQRIPNGKGFDKILLGETPLIFVIEKFSNSSPKWEVIGKTLFNLQMVNVAYSADIYKWRITAVGPNGTVDEITSLEYTTLDGYLKPGPPKRIYVVDTSVNNSSVNVLIGWDPPEEKACFYKILLETHEGVERYIRIKDEPLGVHRYWFDSLRFETQYSILITSRDPSWDQNSQSNLTRLDFVTPTCLQSYNYRFDKCVPPPPRNIQSKIQDGSDDGKNVAVILSWKPPQNTSESNPILKYVVAISQMSFKSGGMSSNGGISKSSNVNLNSNFSYINFNGTFNPEMKHIRHFPYNTTSFPPYEILGNTTQIKLTDLPVDAQYTAMVTAFSIRGPSPPAEYHLFIKPMKDEPIQSPLSNWLYLTIPVSIIMLILLGCNVGRAYLHKRQVKLARNQYFQSMEERDAMSGDWSIVPLTEETSTWKLFDDNFPKERWEILYENLTMGEVIGQGAFGVVRRAKIPRKKLQSSTLKYLDKQNHYSMDADKCDTDMETVAVKMLKVSATREDREQLIKEIMTMQSLGFHPQIVGLIGACTKGRSLCLVLEYCPGGDLLTFIRKVRAKYWPTMGLSDCKKNSSLSSAMSPDDNTASRSCSSGRDRSKTGDRNSPDDSPINYADIEGFSDCSSLSDKIPEGNPAETTEDTRPRSRVGEACQSPSSHKSFHSNASEDDDNDFRPIDEKDVLSYARQIAMGMEYLEKNRIVHRDLAGRNCLLMGDHKQVKLSDFGLSRDIYTWNVYHQKSNGKLPLKWMAIESIFSHVFTTKSDVWSYGILLWELVTLGGTPYPGLGNTELFHLLKSGYRMERPDNSSEELYAVMKKCWRTSPAARPNFTELRHHVETMMEAAEPNLYLSLMADIPSDYFRLGSRSDLLQMQPETTGEGSGSVREVYTTGNDNRHGPSYSQNGNPKRTNRYAGYHNTNSGFNNNSSNTKHSLASPSSARHDIISNTPLRQANGNGVGESGKGYSRSNSNSTNCSSSIGCGPSLTGSESARSSLKIRLGNISRRPESLETSRMNPHDMSDSQKRRSLLSPDSGRPRSEFGFLEAACSNTNSFTSSSAVAGSTSTLTLSENPDSEKLNGRPRDARDDDDDGNGLLDIDGGACVKESGCVFNFNEDLERQESISDQMETELQGGETPCPLSATVRLPLSYPFRHVNNMTIIENKTYDLHEH